MQNKPKGSDVSLVNNINTGVSSVTDERKQETKITKKICQSINFLVSFSSFLNCWK